MPFDLPNNEFKGKQENHCPFFSQSVHLVEILWSQCLAGLHLQILYSSSRLHFFPHFFLVYLSLCCFCWVCYCILILFCGLICLTGLPPEAYSEQKYYCTPVLSTRYAAYASYLFAASNEWFMFLLMSLVSCMFWSKGRLDWLESFNNSWVQIVITVMLRSPDIWYDMTQIWDGNVSKFNIWYGLNTLTQIYKKTYFI